MDKVAHYQNLILQILTDYTKVRYSNLDAENQLIADKEQHRYQVVTIGWEKNGKFVHDCPMHMDIINGKIWVQRNMTEVEIDKILIGNGVPKTDIVLGFFTPKMREYTDFALA
jgi:XisI protein